MRLLLPFLLVPSLLGLSALRPSATTAVDDQHAVLQPLEAAALRLEGTLVCAEVDELSLALTRFQGRLTLASVAPAGRYVEAGDVLARFDSGPVESELVRARAALAAAEVELAAAKTAAERGLAQDQGRLSAAHALSARTSAELEAWRSRGRALEAREAELEAQRRADAIEDQALALEQLEAEYREDERVDAAEEAVLARVRRDLARARVADTLALDARAEYEATALTAHEAQLEEAAQLAAEQLATLESQAPHSAARRALTVSQAETARDLALSATAALERDLQALELRAGRAGLVLHGARDTEAQGRARPRLETGDGFAPGEVVLCVATPDRYSVSLRVPQAEGGRALHDSAVSVTLDGEAQRLNGTLQVGALPSAVAPRTLFPASVALGEVLPGRAPGMQVSVEIERDAGAATAYLMPRAALTGAPDSPSVWLSQAEAGLYRRVPVQVQQQDTVEVTVTGDLTDGGRVLLWPDS